MWYFSCMTSSWPFSFTSMISTTSWIGPHTKELECTVDANFQVLYMHYLQLHRLCSHCTNAIFSAHTFETPMYLSSSFLQIKQKSGINLNIVLFFEFLNFNFFFNFHIIITKNNNNTCIIYNVLIIMLIINYML